MDEIGNLGFPIASVDTSPFGLIHDYRGRQMPYLLSHSKSEIGIGIKSRLERDIRIKALEGKMISNGSGSSRFDVRMLLLWYLQQANANGVDVADKRLEDWLEADEVECAVSQYVYGPTVENDVDLFEGFQLRPAKNFTDKIESENTLRQMYGWNSHAVAQSAFEKKVTVPKIDSENGLNEALSVAWKELFLITKLFNALDGRLFAIDGKRSTQLPEETPLGIFGGGGNSRSYHDTIPDKSCTVDKIDVETFARLFKIFKKLGKKDMARVDASLSRLAIAKARRSESDAALDLGIALESLLVFGGDKSNLSYRLAISAAWLLESDPEKREAVFREAKKIYGARSAVAHTGALRDSWNADWPDLVARVVREIIFRGGTLNEEDWTKLVLGSPG